MNSRMVTTLGFAMLFGLSGCATTGSPGDPAHEREYVKITGSRIARPADSMGRIPDTAYPLHVVSRHDIEQTGASDIAGALGTLPFVDIIR